MVPICQALALLKSINLTCAALPACSVGLRCKAPSSACPPLEAACACPAATLRPWAARASAAGSHAPLWAPAAACSHSSQAFPLAFPSALEQQPGCRCLRRTLSLSRRSVQDFGEVTCGA